MQLANRQIFVKSNAERHNLYLMGDFHLGSETFDQKTLEADIKHVAKDPHGHAVLLGDLAECIMPDDKRFESRQLPPLFLHHQHDMANLQLDIVTALLEPISDKILVICEGNHEQKLVTKNVMDFTLRLRDRLNQHAGRKGAESIVYGAEMCCLRLGFKKFSREKHESRHLKFLFAHGFGAGRTKGSKLNKLMEMRDIMPGCDGYAMAHHHDKVTDRVMYLDLVTGPHGSLNLAQRKQLLGICGSYYRTYQKGSSGNYASRKHYRPTDLGAIFFEVKPFHGHGGHGQPLLDSRDLVY